LVMKSDPHGGVIHMGVKHVIPCMLRFESGNGLS
jgi:hypothetical protein